MSIVGVIMLTIKCHTRGTGSDMGISRVARTLGVERIVYFSGGRSLGSGKLVEAAGVVNDMVGDSFEFHSSCTSEVNAAIDGCIAEQRSMQKWKKIVFVSNPTRGGKQTNTKGFIAGCFISDERMECDASFRGGGEVS
jgi:hypothetical protein